METGLRHRLRHRNLDASKSTQLVLRFEANKLPAGAPTLIEPRPYDLPDRNDRNEIRSYATKALVPYIKDDERPSFSGAQGAVYRATLTTTTGLLRRAHVDAFAIKEIRLGDIRARERLRNEIKHLRLCDHPNILRLREAYTIDQEQWTDTTFLVTEPWAQASLQRFIESVANSTDGRSSLCPWYVPQNLEPWPSIVRQCILGVKHLHENSIKHKDLKPDNILLLDESNGDYLHPKVRPIIADFGISKEYVAGARTTFQGTLQYLAPEQVAKESSTPQSDIFSLGCCFAWVQSLLGSKPWKAGSEDEQGIFQLEELVCVGFSITAASIPNLLGRLRVELSPKRPEKVEFLFAMEEMIATMLVVTPSKRANLGDLLKRLDSYEATCRQFRQQKFVVLCVTSGRNTKVTEVDISDISTDAELFEAIKRQIIASYRYPNLFGFIGLSLGILSVSDVRFIKFTLSNDVFKVLDGPNSMPPESLVRAKEYDYLPSPLPIPRSWFIHLLSKPPIHPPTEVPISWNWFIHLLPKTHIHIPVESSLEHFWLDHIPKRLYVTGHRGHAAETTEMQSDNVGWGIEIVKDARVMLLFSGWILLVFLVLNSVFSIGLAIWKKDYTQISITTNLMILVLLDLVVLKYFESFS
jgi:serine/threonine protein kinase